MSFQDPQYAGMQQMQEPQYEEFDIAKAFMAWRQANDQAFQQSTGTAGALKLDPVNALNQAAGTSTELLPDGKVRGALIDKAVSMASDLATDVVGPSGSSTTFMTEGNKFLWKDGKYHDKEEVG